MIQLDEWHLGPWVTRQQFLDATDSWSQGTADFGWAVASAWPISRFAERPLVELSRIWMRPDHARHRLWALAVNALIRKRYARRFSVMLLNTWPADYKADEAGRLDWRGETDWDQRRTSMGRLAQAALGVRPLPKGCVVDDQWWYWRPLSDGVVKPRKQR